VGRSVGGEREGQSCWKVSEWNHWGRARRVGESVSGAARDAAQVFMRFPQVDPEPLRGMFSLGGEIWNRTKTDHRCR
jgi:hypothetical protein